MHTKQDASHCERFKTDINVCNWDLEAFLAPTTLPKQPPVRTMSLLCRCVALVPARPHRCLLFQCVPSPMMIDSVACCCCATIRRSQNQQNKQDKMMTMVFPRFCSNHRALSHATTFDVHNRLTMALLIALKHSRKR